MSTLTGKEICAIIQACSKAKVQSLELQTLKIRWNPEYPQDAGDPYTDYSQLPENRANIAASEQASSNSNSDKKYTAEALSDLLLTDPQQYEEYISRST